MNAPVISALNEALDGRYVVERELGAGGMATVYLADDVRHSRPVAVKVLRPELASAVGADRFLREIRTTANLRHPHILPLFDSGDEGGFLYYVMPLVEGESLRERLEREAQLPLDQAMRIVDEVASALVYAHDRGIIHRDIKPENILLEDGHAVVADFGLSRAVEPTADDRLTSVGIALGTPHYMSPEQANGEGVDARSDLYALACVTYEMLAGSPPFTGRTAVSVMARHAMDPVPSLETVRREATGGISAAIERALSKVPAERYDSVEIWRDTLRDARTQQVDIGSAAGPTGNGTVAAEPVIVSRPPPEPATPLLGRERHLDLALAALEDGARLLTVTGYGGTGKTRFSTEIFRRLADDFPGGAAFVSVAAVAQADDVMPTVANALGMPEAHGRTAVDALCAVFGSAEVLLVLDNLEQVLEAASDVAELVRRSTGLTIVATSRAPLKVSVEREFALPPLQLPEAGEATPDDLMRCASVALFVQRARKVQPSFELTEGNAGAVAEICRRLDGLPLALELAAARVRIMEPTTLLDRLDQALDLLTSGDRDLPLRQRTLRTTISWSYSLLEPEEQRLLRRLAVFHDGWTLEAMEAVCYPAAEAYRAIDELESLVEKGLVRVIGSGQRYGLLETIRAFAAEQLHAEGAVDDARRAHADYFVDASERMAVDIVGPAQLDAIQRARDDNANTLAALQWLGGAAHADAEDAAEKGLSICGNLLWPWHINGQHLTGLTEASRFLELAEEGRPTKGRVQGLLVKAISRSSLGDMDGHLQDALVALEHARDMAEDALIGEALLHVGYVHLSCGRPDEAKVALEEGRTRLQEPGAEFLLAVVLALLGMATFLGGDLPGGREHVESALRMQRNIGDYEGRGLSLSCLAQMTFAEGDHAAAMDRFREALDAFGRVGDRPEVARLHVEMGWAALGAGDPGEARAAFVRGVRAYEEVGSPRGTGTALMGLAAVETAAGRTERAVTIAGVARELSARAGVVVTHAMDPGVAERIESLKASIPEAALEGLEAEARELTPAAVLAMVAE